ncbi:hypothetical protein NEOLEDRAFT_1094847 [Neolentinus lepideus HHB14362 ss-1]|uniref:BTB domain-containing protein n=1 Tax=Neolentinus lepideus HHB14362 ss-1 TaxID=1314782 RepID=A0A165RSL7_9AGAM|nr:hypothetical protein NEOLEDRAFT_1094847 [Neolentinus lepideus HHB14362 ss-1]
MQVETHEAKLISYHPLFSSDDADVVLGCKDGTTYFRLHSFILKMTSSWFRTMFSLPQQTPISATPPEPSSRPGSSDIIHLDEDANTLEGLFRMICGQPIPRLDSYDIIEPLLYAAEKYDMLGPISIIRALVMTPALLQEPLRLYPIACRFGWEDEARLASAQTLTLNIHEPQYRPHLQKLATDALLDLFSLHRERRERLKQRLNETPFIDDRGPATCTACGFPIDYHTWRELKYKIIFEMDERPLGDTICNAGLIEWREARACWDARCSNVACSRVLYDKAETARVIRECIDQLPTTI